MTKKKSQLERELIEAAIWWSECFDSDGDDDLWDTSHKRLWDAIDELKKVRVSPKISSFGKIGRPLHPHATEILEEAKRGELTAMEIAKKYGCHRNTVYHLINLSKRTF